MKFPFLSLLSLFLTAFASAQTGSPLSRLIDSLAAEDQEWRGLMVQVNNGEIDSISLELVREKINRTDSLNFIQIKKLFSQYGFPGYNMVGEKSSDNFWLLVQHADKHPSFQDSVLAKMKTEAEKGNASLLNYAYLADRVKVNNGQLQIYGTQMTLNTEKNSFEPMPTMEPEKLDERRQQAGLPPIEDYIRIMNQRYHGSIQKK